MKPEIFAEQLADLIDRALADNPPVPRMIYELHMNAQRMITLQLATERREQMKEMASGIIPAIKMPGQN